jgi:hypothetical protein
MAVSWAGHQPMLAELHRLFVEIGGPVVDVENGHE